MNDQHHWDQAILGIDRLLASLSADSRSRLSALADRYRQEKERLGACSDTVDGATDCAACRGLCCRNGKYRMNTFDIIACRLGERALPVQNFSQAPLCPYGSAEGCYLPADLRPLDCIVFICDTIDAKLDAGAREEAVRSEHAVRECLRQAEEIVGCRLSRPMLLFGSPH